MIKTIPVLFSLLLYSQVFAASDPRDLLPSDNAVKGWKQSTAPKIYKDSQLWEYINGGADVYLDYGFQRVATVDLSSGKRTVVVDIYEMKKRYGDRLCLIGNIELATVLATGTPQDVIEDTKMHLRRLAPGGGYCLGSSNSVTSDVPIENYRAMIDTVMEFGKYPICA